MHSDNRNVWRCVAIFLVMMLVAGGCSRTETPKPAPGTETKTDKAEVKSQGVSAGKLIDRGLSYLCAKQSPDGAYRGKDANPAFDIGTTGLVLKALASSDRAYRETDGPFVSKAVKFLLDNRQADGGIRAEMLGTYTTSIAVTALASLENEKHKETIDQAVAYIKGQQFTERNGYDQKEHSTYGGFGYGSTLRPDLSNTQTALDAFEAAGLPKDDPAYKAVAVFLSRCQNNSETNDQGYAGTDGGAVYNPNESKAGTYVKPDGSTGLRSYGSMTYALLKSMVYANLSKDDPRVKAASAWIRSNYTLEENPGIGQKGRYYYYVTFAKALNALGEDVIVDDKGVRHEWRKELVAMLASLQKEDGSWVNEQSDQWGEADPVLATSFAVLALEEAARKPKGGS